MSEGPNKPKFDKPKVLLIDLPEGVGQVVGAAGFNACVGTFGRPFRVRPSDGFIAVPMSSRLPNYAEQEIVCMDLTLPEPKDGPYDVTPPVIGEMDWWAKCSDGIIDPRPRGMKFVQEALARIWETGGVFVVFGSVRLCPAFVYGKRGYAGFEPHLTLKYDIWSFLPFLDEDHIQIAFDPGNESVVCESLQVVERFLRRHQDGLHFDCAFRPLYPLQSESDGPKFFPLMENKYGRTIAGLILPHKPGKGRVFILPQLEDKAAAVLELLQSVLPELSPHLFPYAEGGKWVQQEQYEHPGVLEKRARQADIKRQAAAQVAQLEQEIEVERAALGYLHGLLTHTDDELVADVKAALADAGFKKVVDVDKAEAGAANKQEDLQVHDTFPTLLVEIKGLIFQPREDDTHQVTKYVSRRMKQWGRTDVRGLVLINHQRNILALDRDHDNVFTGQQVQDAEQNETGLMTTWDLFRLLRGKKRWGWPSEAVCNLLYCTGRIPSYPAHYTPIGKIVKYWPDKKVASIDVEGERPLKVGDRIGFLLSAGFHEEEVTSLQLDRQAVLEAFPGQRTGHKTELTKADAREGTLVFRVGK